MSFLCLSIDVQTFDTMISVLLHQTVLYTYLTVESFSIEICNFLQVAIKIMNRAVPCSLNSGFEIIIADLTAVHLSS